VSIVMGLDQHRAQITGEWIDTETGEAQRARVAPADRAGWRPRIAPGGARGSRRGAEVPVALLWPELEVALEVTTGWRFVVEEL